MYRRLLIATDGPELAAKAVRSALALAKQLGARVVIVTAVERWSSMTNGEGYAFDFPIDEYEAAVAHAERILASARANAQNTAIECEAVRVGDIPAEAILATANAKNCDLIVMASHGRRGLSRFLLGSQATRVYR